ncbi:MAG: 16S rRNA (guanine(527)-N(7))-methyltransferase RsmG [Gammaproteobacteria bacterium]
MAQQDWRPLLSSGLVQLGLALPTDGAAKLLTFIELLVKWNAAYNLTAVRAPAEMVNKHLLDSLAVAPFLRGESILDVGTGAGLPGIPLAIAFPNRNFTLLDSHGKKTRFVTHAVTTLGLKNVEVVQARAEDYHPAEGFATVISRAFASLADFLKLTAHLCAPGGRWLAMKGERPDDELQPLPAGFRMIAVTPVHVPGLDVQRCVVKIERQVLRSGC